MLKGFMYTLIVLMLALSYMYIVMAENDLPFIPNNYDILNEVKVSSRKLYGLNVIDGKNLLVQGRVGKKIHIEEYKNVVRNYGIMKNSNISINLEPGFACGDISYGYDNFNGDGLKFGIEKNTEINITLVSGYSHIDKNISWSKDGDQVILRVRSNGGLSVIEENGLIDDSAEGSIIVYYDDGSALKITIKNSMIHIEGNALFSIMARDANCISKNNGYVIIDGKKRKI